MAKIAKRIETLAACGILVFSTLAAGCSKNVGAAGSSEQNEGAALEAVSTMESVDDTDNTDAVGIGEAFEGSFGGWKTEKDFVPMVNASEADLFERAVSDLTGASYEAVAVIGQQVVSGMNYAYFCQQTLAEPEAEPAWSVVVVYKDVLDNASVTVINDFDPAQVKTLGADADEGTVVGGWTCPLDDTDPMSLSDDAYNAFTTATTNTDSAVVYEPIVLLATQDVSGINYRLLCKGTLYLGEPVADIYVVDIHKEQDGSASVVNSERVDILSYVTPG